MHLAVAGVVEEVAGPAALEERDDVDLHELEAHGLGVEAVGRFEVTGGDRNVVESHAPSLPRCGAWIRRSGPLDPIPSTPTRSCQFRRWYDEARRRRRPPARCDDARHGRRRAARPEARTVLLRGLDERGFAFYTNLESAKARELGRPPAAALVFHWRELERQVRVDGTGAAARRATRRRGTGSTRPRGHRLSAWASPQSEVVDADDARGARRGGRGAVRRRRPAVAAVLGRLRRRRRRARAAGRAGQDRLHDRVRYRPGRRRRHVDPRAARAVNAAPRWSR